MSDEIEKDDLDYDVDETVIEEEVELEPEAFKAEPKPKKRFGAPALIGTAFLSSILGAGVIWLSSQYFQTPAPDMAPLQTKIEMVSKDMAALTAENKTLKSQISKLQNTPVSQAAAAAPVDLTPIEARLKALEGAKPTQIDPELVTRLEALQSSGSEALDLTDILARLDTLEGAEPETRDMSDIEARIEALENAPVTQQPVATLTAVSAPVIDMREPVDFPLDAVLASLPKTGSWLERSLKKHISVQSEDNPRYLAELIQKSIEDGDIEAAIAAFDKLPPDAKAAAQAWRDGIKA